MAPTAASANPTGGSVVVGAATIGSQTGNAVLITQNSNRAIIDWNTFSIGSGQITTFLQPSATAAILNRVTGANPSSLLGALNANGQVFLINPNGVLVGQGAAINAGSFAASTLDIPNAQFMAGGDLTFSGSSNAAVANLGSITAGSGDVYLIAQQVTNAGKISARHGTAGLAAGTEVTLTMNGTESVLVKSPVTTGGAGAAVLNSGTISAAKAELNAADGNLYALAINNTGVIRATGVHKSGGQIFLTADGDVSTSGVLNASASGANAAGGQVIVTGARVNVGGSASISANGGTNGGTILIGGDIHGGSVPSEDLSITPVATAQQTTIAQGAQISANGGKSGGAGDGGSVVVWSDQQTNFQGSISARGGPSGGNGGFAEVSSRDVLNYAGSVDLLAANGKVGELLLDPENVTIESNGGADLNGSISGGTFTPSGDNSILDASLLESALGSASVTVTTGTIGSQNGNITVASPLTWTAPGGGSTLTLTAAGGIYIDAAVAVPTNGSLAMNYSTSAGNGLNFALPTAGEIGSVSFASTTGSTLTLNSTSYTLLNSFSGVQGMSGSTGTFYALANSVSASGAGTLTDAAITSSADAGTFAGTFEGLGNTLSGLTINSSDTKIGLFGTIASTGTVRDLGLIGGSVTIASGATTASAGMLAGYSSGTIANSYTTGAVASSNPSGHDHVGGLVGYMNSGAITQSFASGSVTDNAADTTGNDGIGGLVGYANSGSITQSFASGSVTDESGGGDDTVGGLVGVDVGTITQSFATGAVTDASTSGTDFVGGLVGFKNTGTLVQSYASGAVTNSSPHQGDHVGGLFGSENTATVQQSYESGTVTAQTGDVAGGFEGNELGGGSSLTSVYYDTTANPGLNASAAGSLTGVSGLSTSILQDGSLPSGFNASIGGVSNSTTAWTAASGSFPYASWAPQETITGTVYNGLGSVIGLSGATVSGFENGTAFGATSSATASNGAYSVTETGAPIPISTAGTEVLVYLTSGGIGVGYALYDAPSSLSGLNLYQNTLYFPNDSGNLSGALGKLSLALTGSSSTFTNLTGLPAELTALSLPSAGNYSVGIAATGSFDFDQAINLPSGGSLSATATGGITVDQSIIQSSGSSGGNITLTTGAGTGNALTIAAATTVSTASAGGVVTLQADNLSLGGTTMIQASGTGGGVVIEPSTAALSYDIGFSNPDTADYITLTAGELNDIHAPTLSIGNAGANNPLIVDTAAHMDTGSGDSLQNVTNLTLLGGTGGVTVNQPVTMGAGGALTLNTTGAFSQLTTGILAAPGGLDLLGTNENYNLTGADNAVSSLAASVGSGTVQLNDNTTALEIGTVNGTAGVTAGSLYITDQNTVDNASANGGAPISVTNLDLLGTGGSYTLTNTGNAISTLAASTSAISVADASALTINSVNGTIGLTATGSGGITLDDSNAGGVSLDASNGAISSSAGPIDIKADAITVADSITSSGQTVTIEPHTTTETMALGTGAGTFQLSQAAINEITAGTFQFGGSSQSGALAVGGSVTTPSTISNLVLETAGPISIAASASASVTNSNPGGSIALITNSSPTLSSLTAISTGSNSNGTVIIEPLTPATTMGIGTGSTGIVDLTQAQLSHITTGTFQFGGSTTTGPITVGTAGVTAPSTVTNLTLETAGLITVQSTGAATDSNAGGTLTLQTDTTPSLGHSGALSSGSSTSGTVAIIPLNPADTLGLGTATGTLQLTEAALGDITAGTLQYGSSAQTGTLTSAGTVTTPATISSLALATQGLITITSGTVSATTAGASIALETDTTPALASGSISVTPTGTVIIAPATPSEGIDIGPVTPTSTFPNFLQLPAATLNEIVATNLQIGTSTDTVSPILVDVNANLDSSSGHSLQNVTNLALVGGSGGITIDEPIAMPSGGTLTLNTTGLFSQGVNGSVTASGLLLLGANTDFNLGGSTPSDVSVLAANAGTVELNNGSNDLSIGTVAGSNGVIATTLTITDGGNVTQTEPISADLDAEGTAGSFALTNAGNSVSTVAGNMGAIDLTDSIPLTVVDTGNGSNLTAALATNGADSSAAITLTDSAPGGITLASGSGTIQEIGAAGASVVLTADAMSLSAAGISSPNTVTLQPYTKSLGVDLGASGSQGLQLQVADLQSITAPTLVIGNTSDTTNPVLVDFMAALDDADSLAFVQNLTLLGGSGGISIQSPITLAGGEILTLNTTGTVTQSTSAEISGDSGNVLGSGPNLSLILLGSGGTFNLNGTPNSVNSLAANVGTTGSISLDNTTSTPLSIDQITGPDAVVTTGVTAKVLQLTSDASGVTQTQPISASELDLEGSGAVFTLNGATNAVSELSGDVGASGAINLLNGGTNLSIGTTTNGATGVTAGTLTLNDTGAVTQTEPISANLDLLGSGGIYTLNNSSNSVSTLAGNTGTVSLTDGGALTVNTVTDGVTSTDNLTATGPVTLIADSIALAPTTGLISDIGQTVTLQPLTGGTGITLGGAASGFDLTADELNDITATNLVVGSDGGIGNASGAISATAAIAPSSITNLGLLSGSSVGQTTGSTITVSGLKVSGSSATLPEANSVTTLAMQGSGALDFNNSPSLTIGTVLGTFGVTSTGGTVLVEAGNSLTLSMGASPIVSGVGSGNAVQLVDGLADANTNITDGFTNNDGSNAISVTSGGGRWLVWSINPTNVDQSLGSLTYLFKQYAASYGVTTPADTTHNGVMYTIAPTISQTLQNTVQKPYDGTDSVTNLTATNYASPTGAIDGDTVTLTTKPTSGSYDAAPAPDVGIGIDVAVTGLTYSATNGSVTVYGYNEPTAANGSIGTITAAPLTISGLSATNKQYDTMETDALSGTPTLAGVIAGDISNVMLSGSATSGAFASPDVATGITVTADLSGLGLTGTKALDYSIMTVTAPLSANITTAPVTISGLTATNKQYDTTEADTLGGTAALAGVFASDQLNVTLNGSATSGTFASPDVATGITVTAGLSGLSLTGTKALDYSITTVTTPLAANITTAPVTISGLTATNKQYDTTEADTLGGTAALAGVFAGDQLNVTLNGSATSGTFASPDVATGITVTAGLSGLSLTGTKALDYSITTVTTPLAANITTAPVSIGGLTATNKQYDTTEADTLGGTATLAGVFASDLSNVALNGSATSGTFASPDVATGITVTASLSGLSLTGTKALDYSITTVTAPLAANITAAPVTISGLTATNKQYDTTEADTLGGTAALAGVFASDQLNVTLNGSATSGTFASPDVATGITVTAGLSGLSLTGTKALDYSITTVTTPLAADITTAPVTISGLTATNKQYDTTEADTLGGTAALAGVFASDLSNVALSGSATSGTFTSPDVATGITVNAGLSGLGLSGSKALDYSITTVTAPLSANITAAPVTISGLTATNKQYDTTEADTLGGTAALAGVFAGDQLNVTLNGSATSGSFASPDVATGITVTAGLSGLSLTGTKALDYSITTVTAPLSANITTAPLTISGLTATNRQYDTTEADTLGGTAALAGVFAGDQSNVALGGSATSGTFASPDVATGITVTAGLSGLSLTGTKALDYSITTVTAPLSANITTAPVTISGLAATNKQYDTTEADTLGGTAALAGVFAGDQLNVTLNGSATSGTFASPDVATGITVTAGLSGLSLTGTKALDYSITTVTTPLAADITTAPLTISGLTATNKQYDTTEADTLGGTAALAGVFAGDLSNVALSGSATSGTFASPDVATGITVAAGLSGLSLTGTKALDYSITTVTAPLAANITAAPVTISGLTATNKQYDTTEADTLGGTAALAGVFASDQLNVTLNGSATSGTFASPDVATGIAITADLSGLSLTGTKALDYSITTVTTPLAANITTAPVSIGGLTATNKQYDTTEADTLGGTATLAGVFASDLSNVALNGSATSGTFASPDVATGITVTASLSGLSLTGTKALDYSITTVTAPLAANITAAPVTISGLTATNKQYDTTEADTLGGTAALAGVFASDQLNVTLNGSATSGTFASPDVATGITVTAGLSGLSLTGTKALDYSITTVTTPLAADITTAPVTISGLTATNKQYDTAEADTLGGTASVTGVFAGDLSNVALNGSATSGTFASPDVATGITVTAGLSGLSLTGTKALDYSITTVTAPLSANITAAPVTISGLTATNKQYDTTEADTLGGTATLAGVFAGDQLNVTLNGSATSGSFASPDVATGITVTAGLSGLSLTGTKALDYSITTVTAPLSANITTAPVTISGLAATNKQYDTTEADTLGGTATLAGVFAGDQLNVTLNGSATSGSFASPDVATGITVTAGLSGLSLTGTKALDYSITTVTAPLSANITTAPLTISGLAASNKQYDTTEADTLGGTAALAGVFAGDLSNVALSGSATSGTFASPDVATGITVTAGLSGLSLTGTKALDYSITTVTTPLAADITTAPVTISGLTATNKQYDTTETDTLGGTAALAGVFAGDLSNVALSGSTTSGTFASPDVATGITVTAGLSGLSLTGTKALDYSITTVTAPLSANITTAPVTISGLTATNKQYDTTEADTLGGTAALAGVFASDLSNVALNGSATSGTFASPDVATGITVTAGLSGLSLTGTKALDYSITTVTTPLAANITTAPVTISGLTAINKQYDTTEADTLGGTAALAGVFAGDQLNVTLNGSATSGSFASPDVATGITVAAGLSGLSLTGTKALDYSITTVTAPLSANITTAPVTISGLTATNKQYDTTEADTLGGTAALAGVFAGDQSNVALGGSATSGTFASPDVATGITVTAGLSGLSLTGTKALDYSITTVTTPLAANITTAPVTISGLTATNKQYDTTEADTLGGTAALAGVFAGDQSNVALGGSATSGTFASPDVATGITVTAGLSGLSLTGTKALDYSITTVTTPLAANITTAPVTISGLTATNKQYDTTEADTLGGTAALAGVFAGDLSNVALGGSATSGTFASPDVATGITVTAGLSGLSLTGTKALDYSITTVTAPLSANITAAPVTISGLTATNKQYDTTEADTLGGTAALAGVFAGDLSNVALSGSATSGTFASPDVATGITVTAGLSGLSLTGTKALDYSITTVTAPLSANITTAPVTIGGLTATNKQYDTTEADTLGGTATLAGVFASDLSNVALNGSATSGTFASPDVATGITVTASLSGLSLTGTKALDYSITTVTAPLAANITAAPVTISGLTATNKQYDTTEADTLGGTAALAGVFAGDLSNVALSGSATSGTFASPDVATGITVTAGLSGLSLTGTKALDYSITTVTTPLAANITTAPVTISGLTATNKQYDTTEADTLGGTAALAGVFASDQLNVTLNGSATSGSFASPDVATGITVAAGLSGLSLTGTKALDYSITTVTTPLSANITTAPLTISGLTATNKQYDTTEADTLGGTAALAGVFAGDQLNVTLNGSATSGTFASPDVATGITVTAGLSGLSLTGTKALDYSITTVTTPLAANITTAPVTISGLTATNKQYDTTEADTLGGTAALAGVFAGDQLNVTLNGSATSGTFASPDVATGITVAAGLSGLSLTGTKALDYSITTVTAPLSANITAAPVTISGLTAANKQYDTTEADTLGGTAALAGVFAGDLSNVALNGSATSGTFASPDVATGITVTAGLSGLGLTGTKALDYSITTVTAPLAANITTAPLTISGLTATNKQYDTTEADSLGGTAALAGVFTADLSNVTLTGTATSGTFGSPDVATGITVTAGLSGLGLTGSKALDYSITTVTAPLAANITTAPVTISGLTATSKQYDTTEADTLGGTAALAGVFAGDQSNVTLTGTATSGTFASPDVATGITVTAGLSGLGLTGSKALDYSITTVTAPLSANITTAPLTISGLTTTNKVYNTTTADTLSGTAALSGVYAGDVSNVNLTGTATAGTFASPDVANSISVSAILSGLGLSGSKALDYSITTVTSPLAANITPAPLTVSGLTTTNKVYNTTTADTLSGTAALVGVYAGDVSNVNITGTATSGTFESADVANGISVAATLSGLGLSGSKALDYSITTVTTPLAANITPAPLTISGLSATNKVYDTTEADTLTGAAALVGIYSVDQSNVTLTGSASSGTFASPNVADAITVTATLSGLSLSGTKASDYSITTVAVPLSANITPATLTISGLTAQNKIYDTTSAATLSGTATLAGILGSDAVTLSGSATAGAFASPNVANGISVAANLGGLSLGGAQAGDYQIGNVLSPLSANITPATLTYNAGTLSQVYGTVIPTLTGTVTGFVGGQTLATATTGTATFATPATQSSNVGKYAINGSGLAADNGDYTFVQAAGNSTALTITPATLIYVATPATDTAGSTIVNLSGTLNGFLLGQNESTATTGTMVFTTPATASSPVGTYAIDGSGLTAQNYIFAQAAANATALTLQDSESNPNLSVIGLTTTDWGAYTPSNFSGDGGFDSDFGDGNGDTGDSVGSTTSYSSDTGDADTSIKVGRLVVAYRTEIKNGRAVYPMEEGSLGMASSFTTFDKNDHPTMQVRHRERGHDKEPEKYENANGPSGPS